MTDRYAAMTCCKVSIRLQPRHADSLIRLFLKVHATKKESGFDSGYTPFLASRHSLPDGQM